MTKLSVLIVARNAERTIAEAVKSALMEPFDELVLIDDCSDDATIERALSVGDRRVRIVRIGDHRTLGHARSVGLAAVKGEFCHILDADDAILPGRVERIQDALEGDDLDFVADELELVNGETGALMRCLQIPGFLDRPPGVLRLFERNYLPGVGQIAFKVESMRQVGYDSELEAAEDFDLALRAVASGARCGLIRRVGYSMRHYSNTVSRHRDRQMGELRKVLCKHDPRAVASALDKAGAAPRQRDWCMASFLVFRKDWIEAGRVLRKLAEYGSFDPTEIIEADGPCPMDEGWRLAFFQGTVALLAGGDVDPIPLLNDAVSRAAVPEALNNLGVALARRGETAAANQLFREALAAMPGYADARENLEAEATARRVTTHPLRREPSRSEY